MNKKIYGIQDGDFFFDSWPFIIIALLVFFPLGFILLLIKKELHRRNVFEIGNTAIKVGVIFLLIGAFIEFYFSNIIIVVGSDLAHIGDIIKVYGIIILITGFISKLQAMHYKKYIQIVVNEKISSIDSIKEVSKESSAKVEKTLNELIRKRYLKDYQINNNEVKYIPRDAEIEDYGKYDNTSFHPDVNRVIETNIINDKSVASGKIVNCPNCGANNKVSYTSNKCSYCNTDLSKLSSAIIKEKYRLKEEEKKKKTNTIPINFDLSPYHERKSISDELSKLIIKAEFIAIGIYIFLNLLNQIFILDISSTLDSILSFIFIGIAIWFIINYND